MKDELRQQLKMHRNTFVGDERKRADDSILSAFLAAYSWGNTFFVYNSFGTEADTSVIINALIKAGKKVFCPRVEGKSMVPVPYGKTVKGAFGIEEPVGQAYFGDIDVTVVPLLAVNGRGYRIGYGKGFYDKFLKDKKTLKVGLGYSFQIRDFQEDEWDEPLNEFISEKGIVKFCNGQLKAEK